MVSLLLIFLLNILKLENKYLVLLLHTKNTVKRVIS
nr:MAG TPA: hypothetical protein [Bacteriophage sp.]